MAPIAAAAHPHRVPLAADAKAETPKSRFARPVVAPTLNELHPAIAAALAVERVPQPIVDERSRSALHGSRGATFIAAAVLAGIIAAVIVLVLGSD